MRIIIGLGSAFAFVACIKLGSIWFPARQFAFIIGLTNLFGVLGAIIGGAPIAHSVEIFGWRYVLFGSGVIGIAICFLLYGIIRDSPNKEHHHKLHIDLKEFIQRLLIVLNNRQIWLIALLGGLIVAPIAAYSELWGITFLIDNYGLDRPTAAHINTLTFIGIAIGGPIIGFFSDRLGKRKFPILIGIFGALICISCILLWPNLSFNMLYILHICFGFFSSSMLLCFSLGGESITANIRATTIAFTNTIIMIMGAVLQLISGYLLDYSSFNFSISFVPLLLCYLLALLCYKSIHETKCHFKDGDKVCS